MKVLICGLGSIGKRHAKILKALGGYELFALRSFKGQEANDLNIPELTSWDEVSKLQFTAALITNPTCLHLETAMKCAERGLHLFIEKPIDCTREGLDELQNLVKTKRLTAYIAYPFRFHPVVLRLKEILKHQKILHARMQCSSYMPSWRSRQNFTRSYSRYREMGGGVLLDLSHEFDTAQFLFGEITRFEGTFGKKSDITVDSEDFADVTAFHADSLTQIHLDVFSLNSQRYIEVDTTETFIRADLFQSKIHIRNKTGEQTEELFKIEPDQMYRSQLEYFFGHLNQTEIENSLESARLLFETILDFREKKQNTLRVLNA